MSFGPSPCISPPTAWGCRGCWQLRAAQQCQTAPVRLYPLLVALTAQLKLFSQPYFFPPCNYHQTRTCAPLCQAQSFLSLAKGRVCSCLIFLFFFECFLLCWGIYPSGPTLCLSDGSDRPQLLTLWSNTAEGKKSGFSHALAGWGVFGSDFTSSPVILQSEVAAS